MRNFKFKLLLGLFSTIILCSSAVAQQTGRITGTLKDAANNELLVGAVIEITPKATPTQKKYISTDTKGLISAAGLPYGEYSLSISFLGYETLVKEVKLNQATAALGALLMKQEAKKIDDVVIEVQAIRASQKGDTLAYNADAYKVTADAAAEDILQKMPGIEVSDGKVTAQGENVQKVLVDGKEFFGADVTSAIRNLPADAIDKIEVFNKLSDQAEFSGVDDGESYKAINIVTRTGVSKAQFGKFQAGYGFNDKYVLGASMNWFKNERRITLTGMANNVNMRSFSAEDVMGGGGGGRGGASHGGGSGTSNFMMGGGSGISTRAQLGANYTNVWGKVELSADYSFSQTKTITTTLTDRTYFLDQPLDQLYNSLSESNSLSNNHRIGARLEYKINENNNFMMRPNISYQTSSSDRDNNSETGLGSSMSALDYTIVNIFKSLSNSDGSGYNASNSMIYMHKFGGKAGRTLTASLSGSISKNNSEAYSYSLTKYFNPDFERLQEQDIFNNSDSYRISGRLQYAEPISKSVQLLAEYNISYNYSDRDKKSYDPLHDDLFLDSLSNTYNSGYLTHQVGPGIRVNSGKVMFITNLSYQMSTLAGTQTYPSEFDTSKDFNNLVYMTRLDLKFNPTNTLRTTFRSSTNNPSVTQLQDVLDVTDPLFISQGNPNLKPVYENSMYLNYVHTNLKRGQTFMAMIGGSTQSNSISDATEIADKNGYEVKDDNGNTIITLDRGAQYTRPVNLNGYWGMNGMVNFGTPVNFLKSNINFNLRASYRAMPTVFNKVESITQSNSFGGGLVLGSNISKKLDFTFAYNIGYNYAKNSVRTNNNTEYLNQSARGNFKWITWKGITLQANASYTKYSGISDDFSEDYVLLNATLGKKIFKNQRGEVNLGVNDILNQSKSFYRTITENYVENVTSNVLGRYLSINFIFNLRNFAGSKAPSNPDTMDRPMRQGMPGMGGFGGGRPY